MNAPPSRPRGLAATIAAVGVALGLLATAAPAHAHADWDSDGYATSRQMRKPVRVINLDVAVPGNLSEFTGLKPGDQVKGYRASIDCFAPDNSQPIHLSGTMTLRRMDWFFGKVARLTLPGAYPTDQLLKTCLFVVRLPDNRQPSATRTTFSDGFFGLSPTVAVNSHYVIKAV